MCLFVEIRFARTFFSQNHCPSVQKVYFRLPFVAKKHLWLSSLSKKNEQRAAWSLTDPLFYQLYLIYPNKRRIWDRKSHKAQPPNKCNQNQKMFLLVTENNDTGYLKETILGRANFQRKATLEWAPHSIKHDLWVSTVLSLHFCSRKAFHSKRVSSKQGREDTSERLILKASYKGQSRKSPERKESILHKVMLTELCLFKPICGAFEAEEKISWREALLCRARGTYVVTKSCK